MAVDFSRTEREFQARVANCRKCLAAGRMDPAFCDCMLGLIEDVGAQVADVRHTAASDRAVDRADRSDLRRELAHFMYRMLGFDDPEKHPEEVGVVGDVRNKVDNLTKWAIRGFWAILTGVGLLTIFLIEQTIQSFVR